MLVPTRSPYATFRCRPLLIRVPLPLLLLCSSLCTGRAALEFSKFYEGPMEAESDVEMTTVEVRVMSGVTEKLKLVPPSRALPAETIVLEGTPVVTQITSLEEYLEYQALAEENLKKRRKLNETIVEQQTSGKRIADNTNQRPHVNQTTPHSAPPGAKPIPQHWQVRSLLNFTHDYPLPYSQLIYGYVWPLVAGITLFTNLMIVFVLTQHDMRTPTNIVLSAIAIADIIPITGPVPWFIYLFAMGNEKQVLYPPLACYFYQHSTRSLSEIFYFLSTWLNLLLAALDYMAACWPELTKKYFRNKVVVLEIIGLTLLALLLNLPQALKVVFKPVKFYYRDELTWGCRALQAKWFKDLVGEYVALYDDIFTAIIVVFVDGGPALGLIILTALLIKQLKRQRIRGHILMEQARTASKRRRERYRQQEIESSARVMIFVLLAFLAVKIPFATTYTLMIIQSRFDIHFVENLVDFQKAITMTDLVFVLSYPINFTIFCCCSKKFRHKCGQLLSECNNNRDSRLASRFMRSISGSLNSSFSMPNSQAIDSHKRRTLESLASIDLKSSWSQPARQNSIVSEVSWPPVNSGPPPPPRLNLEHYEHQLPCILTTECGSIALGVDVGQMPGPDMRDKAEGYVTEIERVEPSAGLEGRVEEGRQSRERRFSSKTASGYQDDCDREEELEEPSRSNGSKSKGLESAGLLSIRQLASQFAARCRSNDNLRVRNGTSASQDTSSWKAKDNSADKRRALSLSNSRLYTLPSSTGQLANVLLNSLEDPHSVESGIGGLRFLFSQPTNNNSNERRPTKG